jgi:hypothetical protein
VIGKHGLEESLKQVMASVLSASSKKMFVKKHRGTANKIARVESKHPTDLHA